MYGQRIWSFPQSAEHKDCIPLIDQIYRAVKTMGVKEFFLLKILKINNL